MLIYKPNSQAILNAKKYFSTIVITLSEDPPLSVIIISVTTFNNNIKRIEMKTENLVLHLLETAFL